MATTKKQVNLYFPPELHERLRVLAFERNTSVSKVVEAELTKALTPTQS